MDREAEIEKLTDDIARCVNRWWNELAHQGVSLVDHLRENITDGELDHLALVRDHQGRVLVPIHPVELSFMRRFDPDRDRTANRRELVGVIQHWQEELNDALGPDTAPVLTPEPDVEVTAVEVLNTNCRMCGHPISRTDTENSRWSHSEPNFRPRHPALPRDYQAGQR